MSKLRFSVSVNGASVTDDIKDRIERGIRGSGDGIQDEMKDVAQAKIDKEGAIWRGDLRQSFYVGDLEDGDSWYFYLANDSDHAAPIEFGAEYGAQGPPLAPLMAWIMSHLGSFEGFSGDDGGGGPGDDSPSGSFTRELSSSDIESIQTGRDYGLGVSANSDSILIVSYTDGSKSLFKSNDLGSIGGSDDTAIPNEEAFSNLADTLGWTVGPESRHIELEYDGDNVFGVSQAFVEGAEPVSEKFLSATNPDGDIAPIDFLRDYEDRFAKISLMDMLVDNRDRHSGNLLIGPDGELHAIDNGGHIFDPDKLFDYMQVMSLDELAGPDFADYEDQVRAFFEHRRGLIDELVDNSDDIVSKLESMHGPMHWIPENADKMLANDAQALRDRLDELEQEWLDVNFGTGGSPPESGDADGISQEDWADIDPPEDLDEIMDGL